MGGLSGNRKEGRKTHKEPVLNLQIPLPILGFSDPPSPLFEIRNNQWIFDPPSVWTSYMYAPQPSGRGDLCNNECGRREREEENEGIGGEEDCHASCGLHASTREGSESEAKNWIYYLNDWAELTARLNSNRVRQEISPSKFSYRSACSV